MKNIKIFPKDWLQLHPYKQSTPVDSYYTGIANRIYDIMEKTELVNSFEGEETKQICIRMAAYFEDVISGMGLWRAFILTHKELYGKYLPFYTPDDHYYDDEVNLEDVRFLLWHYTQQYHGYRKGTFVSPDNPANESTGMLIYDLFCKEWTTAPENGVVSNLKASAETNYTITIDSIYEAKKDEVIRVMEIDATTKVEATSLKDTKMIVDVNFLKGSSKEKVMNIKATAPTNDTKITVDFSPAVDPNGDGVKENVRMATLYITSDAMGIITDNETISDEVQEVTVSTNASGLYVKNGKGNYVIVNMVGRVVSTGIITSDEQYISTPNMPNGIYMISIDQSKLLRSAHKTTVKFVK